MNYKFEIQKICTISCISMVVEVLINWWFWLCSKILFLTELFYWCRHFLAWHTHSKKKASLKWYVHKEAFGEECKGDLHDKVHIPFLACLLHTSSSRAKYRLEGCTVIGEYNKVVHQKEKVVIIVHHEDFKMTDGDSEDLYASQGCLRS